MMDRDKKQLVKDSIALLPADGTAVALTFYQRLFELAPEVRVLFPADLARQEKKLIDMLVWLIEHLDKPEALLRALHELGARHAGYKTQVDDYAPVGSALIYTLRNALGHGFTPAMEGAWIAIYTFISTEMERGQREAETSASFGDQVGDDLV